MSCVDLTRDCTALVGFFPSLVFPLCYANAGAIFYFADLVLAMCLVF